MAYDLEEQEKIASLKAWWEKYGNALTSVVLGIAVAVAGYNVWQWYQRGQLGKASATYEELQRAATARDLAHVRELSGLLLDKHGSTAYAEMGALLAAKANLDGSDAKAAKAQLQWTIDHAIDPEYRALGRLRLAGVLLDEGSYDDGLKLIQGSTAAELSTPFQASFADRRGDLYLAENKLADAKREYTAALALLESRSDSRGYANVVQLKLDGLMGGIVATAAPVAAASSASVPPTAPPTVAPSTGAKP